MTYKYSKKLSRSVHILNASTGKTYCKIEHSTAGKKLTLSSQEMPEGRKLCTICIGMKENPNGKMRVQKESIQSRKDFYTSWQWAKLRYEVLKAYGAVCMCCRSSESIVVDHIKSRRKHPELELVFENMQVLCDQCNRGKSYDDETDFRPQCPEPELSGDELAHMKSIN